MRVVKEFSHAYITWTSLQEPMSWAAIVISTSERRHTAAKLGWEFSLLIQVQCSFCSTSPFPSKGGSLKTATTPKWWMEPCRGDILTITSSQVLNLLDKIGLCLLDLAGWADGNLSLTPRTSCYGDSHPWHDSCPGRGPHTEGPQHVRAMAALRSQSTDISMPFFLLPFMASFTAESTGSMFFSTSSSGPGRRAIFSLRSSASRALFSFIWAVGMDLSAVEAKGLKLKGSVLEFEVIIIFASVTKPLCHIVLYHPNNFLMKSS